MRSRFDCEVKITGEVDKEGYVKALRIEDKSNREYHLSDLRTETPEDEAWMQKASSRVVKLRR